MSWSATVLSAVLALLLLLPTTTLAQAPVPDVVARHAPLVYLHPDEPYWPYPAEAYLERAEEVTADDGTRYLDIPDEYHPGAPLGQAPAYYEYVPGDSITYWFFYAFDEQRLDDAGSPRPKAHEGDWERVVVRLDASDEPVGIAYHQHECAPLEYRWHELSGHEPFGSWTGFWDGTHPIVYAALGSHASYPGPRRRADPLINDCREIRQDLRQRLEAAVPGDIDDRLLDAIDGTVADTITSRLTNAVPGPIRDSLTRFEAVLESYRWDAAQKGPAWKTWEGAGLVDATTQRWYGDDVLWGAPRADLLSLDPADSFVARVAGGGVAPGGNSLGADESTLPPVEPPRIPVNRTTNECPVFATSALARHIGGWDLPDAWIKRVKVQSDGSVPGTPIRCRFDIGPSGKDRSVIIQVWAGPERFAVERAAAEAYLSERPRLRERSSWRDHAFLIDGAASSGGQWDKRQAIEIWAELPAQTLHVRLGKGLESLVDPSAYVDGINDWIYRKLFDIVTEVALGPAGSGGTLVHLGPGYCHLLSPDELNNLSGLFWRDSSSAARGWPAERLPDVTNDDPLTPCEFTSSDDTDPSVWPALVGHLAMGVTSRDNADWPREFAGNSGAELWNLTDLGDGSYMVLSWNGGVRGDAYTLVVPFDDYAFIATYALSDEWTEFNSAGDDPAATLVEIGRLALARAPDLLDDAGFPLAASD